MGTCTCSGARLALVCKSNRSPEANLGGECPANFGLVLIVLRLPHHGEDVAPPEGLSKHAILTRNDLTWILASRMHYAKQKLGLMSHDCSMEPQVPVVQAREPRSIPSEADTHHHAQTTTRAPGTVSQAPYESGKCFPLCTSIDAATGLEPGFLENPIQDSTPRFSNQSVTVSGTIHWSRRLQSTPWLSRVGVSRSGKGRQVLTTGEEYA